MSAMSALNALRDFVALCSFKINIAKIKYYVVVELRTIFYLDLCYKIRTGWLLVKWLNWTDFSEKATNL